MSHNILCTAGGGSHGITQLVALVAKEKEVGPLYKYYDLMIGTSVGAINAAALATGKITANELLKLYPNWLDIIFKPKWNPFAFPKYDRQNFINIWNKQFGSMKMKDCQTKLIITSVDMCTDKNHYFKSYEAEDGNEDLMTVITRSFAAPVFFGAIPDEASQIVYVDGGEGANNIPINPALTEAILLQWLQNDIVTFDIFGTGYVDETLSFNAAKNFRWLRQALDFIDIGNGGLARAQSRVDEIDRIVKLAHTLPNIKVNYWDVQIDKKYSGIDEIKNKDKLIEYGNVMASKPLISV